MEGGSRPVRPSLDCQAVSWEIDSIIMGTPFPNKTDASALLALVGEYRIGVRGGVEIARATAPGAAWDRSGGARCARGMGW